MNIAETKIIFTSVDVRRAWATSPGGWSTNTLFFVASLCDVARHEIKPEQYALLGSVDATLINTVDIKLDPRAHTVIVDLSRAARGHANPHHIIAKMLDPKRLAFRQMTRMGEAGLARFSSCMSALSPLVTELPLLDLGEHYEPALIFRSLGKLRQKAKRLRVNGTALPHLYPSVESLEIVPMMIDWANLPDILPQMMRLKTVTIDVSDAPLRPSELCAISSAFEEVSNTYNKLIISSRHEPTSEGVKSMTESYIKAHNSKLKIEWV